MSNEMIEWVAKILANQGESSDYSALARRVIEAMREPTEKMKAAIINMEVEENSEGKIKVQPIWYAMIDAALKED